MDDTYASLMRSFYNSLERDVENNPEKLALAYANFFRTDSGPSYDPGIVLPSAKNINNVSVLSHATPLSFLTKRAFLVADSTLITHYNEETRHNFWHYSESGFHPAPNDWDTTNCYLRCPDLMELGVWLRDCKPLLLAGDLFYYPDVVIEHERESWWDGSTSTDITEQSIGPLCELIVRNRNLVDSLPDRDIKSHYVRTVLQVDLPYIENVDLATFSKVSLDAHDAVERFRDNLRLGILDMKNKENGENFDRELAKIGIEIRDGVRELNSNLKTMSNQRAFQVTGAIVAATTAILVAVDSSIFSTLSTVIGASGGLYSIASVIQEYISKRQQLEDSPYYYLWLLHKHNTST